MTIIRIVTLGDILSIATIYRENLQAAYRGIMPSELLDNLSIEQCSDMWQKIFSKDSKIFVATNAEKVVGFASLRLVHIEADNSYHTAEIQSLHVSPLYWQKRIGTALCNAILETIKLENFSKIIVWVFKKNSRARCFYEKFGFSPTNNLKTHWHSYKIEQIQYEIKLG